MKRVYSMKTRSIRELELQAWWDETLIFSDHFFDTTADISTRNQHDEMLQLYMELQSIRFAYEKCTFPKGVGEIRQHLLNSMTEVVLSFQAFFAGDTRAARLYMQAAEFELMSLQHKADALGLSRLGGEPVVH